MASLPTLLPLFHQQPHPAKLRLGRPPELRPAVPSQPLGDGARQSRHCCGPLHCFPVHSSASVSPFSSISEFAGKASCARSISTRWRSPSSSRAPPGSGFPIRVSGLRRTMHLWGSETGSTGSRTAQLCHLHRRDRCGVVVLRVRHGDASRGLRGIDDEILKAAQIDAHRPGTRTAGSSFRSFVPPSSPRSSS